MPHQFQEGWYTDPYGQHEARWRSDGKPTRLVRDGDVEADDEPPAAPPTRTPVKIEAPDAAGPSDLRRADDAEGGAGTGDLRRADDAEGGVPFDPADLEEAASNAVSQEFQPG